jgi:hypothetical protein
VAEQNGYRALQCRVIYAHRAQKPICLPMKTAVTMVTAPDSRSRASAVASV